MKVIDCFTFFNELDLLEARLEILNDVVDYFVIVEATVTQTLKPKPLYFDTNSERYKKFEDKIIHIVVEADKISNESNLWTMENYQRNQIKRGLELVPDLQNEDFVLISDLDEVPNPKAIEQLKMQADAFHVIAFSMEFYAYYFNLISKGKGWIGTVLTKAETLQHIEPQDLRHIKDQAPRVLNAGWHFSWLGGVDKVYEKLHSCIEPFDKSTVPSKEEFVKIWEERVVGKGQFHLINRDDDSVKLEVFNEGLPAYVETNREKFKHLFL